MKNDKPAGDEVTGRQMIAPPRDRMFRRATTREVIGRDPRLTNIVAGRDGIVQVGPSTLNPPPATT